MSKFKTSFQRFQDGDISAMECLVELTGLLGPTLERYDGADQELKAIRAQISELVEYLGGKVSMPNGGPEYKITSPGTTVSYKKDRIEALVEALETEGDHTTAERIRNCKEITGRAGSLRIINKTK